MIGAVDLLYDWLPHFSPPPVVSPSTWAEANLVLPAKSNAVPGPLRLAAYQRQMIDRIAGDDVRVAVLMMASQVGKSLAIDAFLSWTMAVDPGPTLLVHPTEGKALGYVRDRLDPLIHASPALRTIVGGGRTGGGDAKAHKMFPGGSLNVASSHKPDDLAARAIRFLYLDEVDRFAASAGPEGDPVALAMKRLHTYRETSKTIVSSTPTRAGSRIATWFERGDEQRFFIPCPECGVFDHSRIEQLKFDPGRPDTAHLRCEHCGHAVSESERLKAVASGTWRVTSVGEPGVISFHATELISEFSSLAHVAQQLEAANKSPETKRVFVNTSLAGVVADDAEQLDAAALQERAEPIRPPYPAEIQFVVAGVDVQGSRIECTFLATGRQGAQAVLNHFVLPGDTSGGEPWQALDDLLGTRFPTLDGRNLPVALAAIDTGFETTRVLQFVAGQRSKSRRCLAVKGEGGFDKPVIREGGRSKGMMNVHLVGVDPVKRQIQRRLCMSEPGPFFLHLPDHLPSEYFAGVASERLATKYVRGFARYEFHRIEKNNEPIDCLCYAVAASTLVKEPAVTTSSAPDLGDHAVRLSAILNSNERRR